MRAGPGCESVGVLWFADQNERPWDSILGVKLVGIVIGLTLIVAAIRAMNKKDK